MSKADCNIQIEMLPDSFEIEAIAATVEKMTAAGQLPPESMFSISRIAKESTKKAEAYVAFLSKKFRDEQQANAEKNIQLQTQGNKETAVAAAEATAQIETQKAQLEGQNQAQKYELEKINMEAEWTAKATYLRLETEAKKELIKAAAEAKEGGDDKQEVRDIKKEDREKSPTPKRGGYDLERDSIPRAAGKVEPSLGLPNTSVSI